MTHICLVIFVIIDKPTYLKYTTNEEMYERISFVARYRIFKKNVLSLSILSYQLWTERVERQWMHLIMSRMLQYIIVISKVCSSFNAYLLTKLPTNG